MMAKWIFSFAALRLAVVVAAGVSLIGCESIREATGAAKTPPDEFTVLTKSPLVIPPDYNLRPPQPGIASRNDPEAEDQARAPIFPQDPAAAAAQLGTTYSDSEKLLLTKSNALNVDPGIRRSITSDIGEEDQGPAFAQKVLFQGATAPAQAASGGMAAAPANPAPAQAASGAIAAPMANPAPAPARTP